MKPPRLQLYVIPLAAAIAVAAWQVHLDYRGEWAPLSRHNAFGNAVLVAILLFSLLSFLARRQRS
ncbi:MAG: hypothetical protein ACYC63_14695 [Armatimonadota bacterium]